MHKIKENWKLFLLHFLIWVVLMNLLSYFVFRSGFGAKVVCKNCLAGIFYAFIMVYFFTKKR